MIEMSKFHKILLTMIPAATVFAACTSQDSLPVPESVYEECVYDEGKTEFSVWAPDAEFATLRLYRTPDLRHEEGQGWTLEGSGKR